MKRFLKGALIVLVLALIGGRIALPFIAKRRINETLGSLEGYRGSVEDVSFALYRGGLSLRGLTIRDTKGDFALRLPRLAASVKLKSLLRGEIVADVTADGPEVSMSAPKPATAAKKAKEKARKAEVTVEKKTGKTLGDELRSLPPFLVDRFRVRGGVLSIVPSAVTPEEEKKEPSKDRIPSNPIRVTNIGVTVAGLTNVSTSKAATVRAAAEMADGTADLKVTLWPFAETPTFDLLAGVKHLDLAQLNPLLRWQWDVDVSRGRFDLFTEVKAEKGSFKGYVKPFVAGLKAAPAKGSGPVKKLKQAIVGAGGAILKNKETGKVATKVPFDGTFENPKVGVFAAILNVLRNAFIRALQPVFDKV